MQQDYYKDLEIDKYATSQQIADAYRRLALKWHPKLCKENLNTCFQNFCRVSEAYEVLSDKQKKAVYNQYGQLKLKQGIFENGQWRGGYRFSGNPQDIFEKFFGSKNPYQPLFDKASNKEAKSVFSSLYPNADVEPLKDLVIKVNCSLTELYNGCRKKIQYTKTALNKDQRTTSEVTETKEIEVRPGMSQKNKIVHKDLGHERAGIPSSDLIFEIAEHGERGFKRQGDDLIYTAQVSLLDALDSKPFNITTLDGRIINLSFDEVINPKTVREIKGEGMPVYTDNVLGTNQKGNLIVKFDIVFPQELTETQKNVLTEVLAEE